ncbi:MAG: antibiotic biosynthesis monooxygenase [Alphaproteobacteria bacterium]|nr:MAG: antibiotic biosynthesis monooxygenase [Alphaproteobacteria bacterium]
MIVVSGEIVVAPEDMERLRPAAIRMMAETAKEDGCILYTFAEHIGRPGCIRIYEEWESEAHLEAHFNTPHMAEWRAAFRDVTQLSREVKVLSGCSVRTL